MEVLLEDARIFRNEKYNINPMVEKTIYIMGERDERWAHWPPELLNNCNYVFTSIYKSIRTRLKNYESLNEQLKLMEDQEEEKETPATTPPVPVEQEGGESEMEEMQDSELEGGSDPGDPKTGSGYVRFKGG